MSWLTALLMLPLLTASAWAQDGERARLAAEQQGLMDRFAADERACHQRFAVTACVDELRIRRRAALEPLLARGLAMDDAERQQRAKDRQAARAARPQPASAAVPRPVVETDTGIGRSPPPVTATVRDADPRPGSEGQSSGGQTSRALQAAERARAAAKRAELLNATQAEMARKSAERAATGKAGSGLPVLVPLPVPVPAVASGPAR